MNSKDTRFKKGNPPWNKGAKYIQMVGNKHAFRGDKRCIAQFRYEARKLLSGVKNCSICGLEKTSSQMVVHHIDENPKNNSIKNLQKMCRSCHMEHHRKSITKAKEKMYAKRKSVVS